MPRKPRAQQPQPVEQAADKPQEAAKPRRPRMPRKPVNQQTAAPATGGDKHRQAAQPPRAPRANHRARARAAARRPRPATQATRTQIAAPQQAAKPAQPRRNRRASA
ncbi:MAG: hypothetical protein ACLUHE_14770 [Christensenellales bacterium]